MSPKHLAELVVSLLVAGAYLASYAEYRLNYNLYDFTKDKLAALKNRVLGFFGFAKKELGVIKGEASKLRRK